MGKKKFKTYSEQVNTLKKRGLVIQDISYAEKMLASENYYNIINGYKEPFLDKRYKREKYKKALGSYRILRSLYIMNKIKKIILKNNNYIILIRLPFKFIKFVNQI